MPIHASRSVNARLADIASKSIAENQFNVFCDIPGYSIVILKTEPAYVALLNVAQSEALGPALIINDVVDPYPRSPRGYAEDLAAMLRGE